MPHQLIEDHPDLATALNLLDKWVASTVHKDQQPGLAIGVVYDGELLWGKGYGYADLEQKTPVTLDTRFRIASITKTFTATAIMQLRDAGKLNLDDAVSDHLDWFDLRYEDAPAITIRNLLTHTSGLPRDATTPHWTENNFQTWEELVETTQQRQPTQPPYNANAYSNLGYSLLGGIIEQVSGQKWANYLQRNILEPLDMSETYPVPAADDPQLATGYSLLDDHYERERFAFSLMNGFEASANFASSVNELVKYAKFHLSRGKTPVLSGHTLRDMHRVHWLHENWQGGYGLGIAIRKLNGWTISGHGGAYPGYLTAFNLCREHNMGVIVLTNARGSNPPQYVERAFKWVLPEIIKATKKTSPESLSEWQQYVGSYANRGSAIEIVIRDNQLQIISFDFPDEPLGTLEPTDEAHVFILRQPNQSNETARFELDTDGNVLKFWERNEYYFRK